MSGGMAIITYALAAVSGICFFSGIAILNGGKK